MKFALVGETLSYSLSKKLHNIFYDNNNINATYENLELSNEKFHKFFEKDVFKFNGFNITIPYKEKVIPYLHYISDEAKELNSVNTVVVKDKKLFGYNTDILGFDLMMKYENVSFENKHIIILGTGATANMIKYYAKKQKAKSVKTVSRTKGKGDYTYNEYFKGDIVINTTPLGVSGKDNLSPISEKVTRRFNTIIDINYNPYRSKLLQFGIFYNKKVISGLYMLVAQGILAENLFLEKKYDVETINQVYRKLMSEKNIVLIGLTGCGKSRVGKSLSKVLGRKFIDLDKKIVKDNNMTIEAMFNVSENFFRKKEYKAVRNVSKKNSCVIATGGGVVLNKKNLELIYKNSIVILVQRDVKDIANSISLKGRPLLVDDTEAKLNSIFEDRKKLYYKYAEFKVKNYKVDNCVKQILNYIEVENGNLDSKLKNKKL